MFDDLKGKRVLVTGGVTGIGGAASLGFAAAGSNVVAQYLGGGPELATVEKAGINTVKLDLTQKGACESLMAAALSKLGGLDVIINNAGSLVGRTSLSDLTDAFIDQVFDLNCRQLIHCTRLAAEQMRKQGQGGSIINVGSIAGRSGSSAGGSI